MILMANRWFLVPIIGTNTPDDPNRPKYGYETGISGWTGQQVTVNGSDYYAARFVGSTSALDTVESYSDATSIAESSYTESDFANWLNNTTGKSYTFAEWEDRFLTGDIST